MGRTGTKKENLDLAREHINLAEDLIVAEAKKSPDNKKFTDAELSLEEADSDIEELEDEEELEE